MLVVNASIYELTKIQFFLSPARGFKNARGGGGGGTGYVEDVERRGGRSTPLGAPLVLQQRGKQREDNGGNFRIQRAA